MQRVSRGCASSGFRGTRGPVGTPGLGSRAQGAWLVSGGTGAWRAAGQGLEGSVLTWPRHLSTQGPWPLVQFPGFCTPKQEVFELADSLVSGTSAVGGQAGNAVEGSDSSAPLSCPPLLTLSLGFAFSGSCAFPAQGGQLPPQAGCAPGLPVMALLSQTSWAQGDLLVLNQ